MLSIYINLKLFRVKYEYGRDGSLELRLYLVGAGAQDTGNYTCTIPGIDISRAAVSLFLTLGIHSSIYLSIYLVRAGAIQVSFHLLKQLSKFMLELI